MLMTRCGKFKVSIELSYSILSYLFFLLFYSKHNLLIHFYFIEWCIDKIGKFLLECILFLLIPRNFMYY